MANIQIRISDELKSDAEAIFNDIGISISEAIRLFFKQTVNHGGIPFQLKQKQPNQETLQAFKEAEENLDQLKKYKDVDSI